METFNDHRCIFRGDLVEAEGRIKKLEGLLAKEIQKVAELLKKVTTLEKKSERTEEQNKTLRRYCKKLNGDKKIKCDRSKAMIEYGEIDSPIMPD